MSFVIPSAGVVRAVLIIMHGYGTSACDFASVGDYISKQCDGIEVHILDAFDELDGPSCRRWFDLGTDDEWHKFTNHKEETSNQILRVWSERIKAPAEKLSKYIDHVLSKHDGLRRSNVILAGFSQGAMMALHVGLKEQVGGIISFSGLLVDDSVIPLNTRDNTCSTKVLVIHGDTDDVVTMDQMESSCRHLFKANIHCEKHIEKGMNHSINMNCLQKAVEFVKSVI